ncbi:MAG: hypothetical protein JXR31_05155 [Prolixibacteraceae bacterium]|nr:hypothetical protein [Prolixibacteraceae bacterium]
MNALFIGLTTIDIHYFVDEFPVSNVKIKAVPPDIISGGPATNAAAAFSFLNGSANLVSAIGDSPFKQMIEEDLKKNNIQHFDLVGQKRFHPVLATVVTSKNGDRNIFTHNPENIVSEIDAKKLLEEINPQIIMADGFFPEFTLEVLKIAKTKKIPVILDAGS